MLEVIVPIMNEEECLPELLKRLIALRKVLENRVRLVVTFINDGSSDQTEPMVNAYTDKDPGIRFVSLSRNFGHQIAITAGLDHAVGDYVAIMDADLQDPPEVLIPMLDKIEEGFDVVYGKRILRRGETVFKKSSSALFYWLLRKMCRVDIPADTGDFRLMTRTVVSGLARMPERHRFLRGMIPWMGYKSAPVFYERDSRYSGETKYPLRKMLAFALDAALSFSFFPLRLSTFFGLACTAAALIGGLCLVYLRLFTTIYVPGITAVILTVVMMNGIQNIIMGISGEYIGRLYEESKRRPLYLIEYTRNVQNETKTDASFAFKNIAG